MKITYASMPTIFEWRSHFLVGSRALLVVARRLSPAGCGHSPSRRIVFEPIKLHTLVLAPSVKELVAWGSHEQNTLAMELLSSELNIKEMGCYI